MTLKEYLRHNGISGHNFATLLNISKSALYRYYQRKRAPTLAIATKMIELSAGAITLKELAATVKTARKRF